MEEPASGYLCDVKKSDEVDDGSACPPGRLPDGSA